MEKKQECEKGAIKNRRSGHKEGAGVKGKNSCMSKEN